MGKNIEDVNTILGEFYLQKFGGGLLILQLLQPQHRFQCLRQFFRGRKTL